MFGHTEIVKILAPLTDNPNAPNKDGKTPIYLAAWNGHTEIVNILAPLTANPNAPNKNGKTPSSVARSAKICGILKSFDNRKRILAPLTVSNVQEEFRKKIRQSCKKIELSNEDTEILKILAPLTDNPNAPDKAGKTPS